MRSPMDFSSRSGLKKKRKNRLSKDRFLSTMNFKNRCDPLLSLSVIDVVYCIKTASAMLKRRHRLPRLAPHHRHLLPRRRPH
jgi:hypothetical protein